MMNNHKNIILVMSYLILSINLFALSDANAEIAGKVLLGGVVGIQLLIFGGLIYLVKFLYKKIFKSKEKN